MGIREKELPPLFPKLTARPAEDGGTTADTVAPLCGTRRALTFVILKIPGVTVLLISNTSP